MIDRRTALACAALIALMLASAVGRILTLDDWATLVVHDEAPLPSLLLFAFPACSALVVGALFWSGYARADDAKIQPWLKWGRSLSLSYCAGMLLVQGVAILGNLDMAQRSRLRLPAGARPGRQPYPQRSGCYHQEQNPGETQEEPHASAEAFQHDAASMGDGFRTERQARRTARSTSTMCSGTSRWRSIACCSP